MKGFLYIQIFVLFAQIFKYSYRLIKELKLQKERTQNLKDGIENVCSSRKEAANVLKYLIESSLEVHVSKLNSPSYFPPL